MKKISNTACVIIAAGRGTRMKSVLPKALHKISGKRMIEYTMDLVRPFGFKPMVVVTGYKGAEIEQYTRGSKVVNQKRLLGSANAVLSAKKALAKFKGDAVILYSDTPLIRQNTIRRLVNRHKDANAVCTLLTAALKNPSGYGRILRDGCGSVSGVIEDNEASLYDKVINEVNVGAYCFDSKRLFESLKKVKADNVKKEYYLTDVVSLLKKQNFKIESIRIDGEDEALGVNSKEDLARAEKIVYGMTTKKLLNEGVTITAPSNTYIDRNCMIGTETVIKPFTIIEENVKIGKDCLIGPFARLRPGTNLADKVEIGNFVELTRSVVGERSKIKHHSYIGDSVVGKDVNIGAGTITANYDGKKKSTTVIKDGAFIGSGTIFVAPVIIGKKAITGAGSVITKDTLVPDKCVVAGVPAHILKKKR